MRRALAVSGICHGVVLVALTWWLRFAAPAAEGQAGFVCELTPEPASEIVPAVAPPSEEVPREVREEIVEEVVAAPPDPVFEEVGFQEVLESRGLPDTRALSRRLSRPLRKPLRRPRAAPLPPVAASSVPRVAGVTRAPVLARQNARVDYPLRARRRGWEGAVALRLRVDAEGRVAVVEVTRSSGHAVLDDAACAAAREWRFAPAMRDGEPVAAWVVRTVRFALAKP